MKLVRAAFPSSARRTGSAGLHFTIIARTCRARSASARDAWSRPRPSAHGAASASAEKRKPASASAGAGSSRSIGQPDSARLISRPLDGARFWAGNIELARHGYGLVWAAKESPDPMGTGPGRRILKPWRYTMTTARVPDRKRDGNVRRNTARPRPADRSARSAFLPATCNASIAFAQLRAALHDGPPSPPPDWPARQQRLLQAQDEQERAFLTFANWLRSWRRRAA